MISLRMLQNIWRENMERDKHPENMFSLREKEIFLTLQSLEDCNFVIIGGYAVNTYTLPRFSVDCDIVIKDTKELHKIEKILTKRGYQRVESEPRSYSGHFQRYEKKLENQCTVSMDILISEVSDRLTGVKFDAAWIFKNSKSRLLKGKTISEELKHIIINIDALIVMKIISCRSTDIRDVFMMLPNTENKEWIKQEIALRYDFKDRITKITEKIISPQFKDGLAGVYGYIDEKIFKKHVKAILTLGD